MEFFPSILKSEPGKEYCQRCDQEINPDTAIWTEMSNSTGIYHLKGIPEGEESQGWFQFGKDCVKALKATGELL
jgi:hypothetical protein